VCRPEIDLWFCCPRIVGLTVRVRIVRPETPSVELIRSSDFYFCGIVAPDNVCGPGLSERQLPRAVFDREDDVAVRGGGFSVFRHCVQPRLS
jgi:hypothetical protein